jgi:hypothetical protein
MNEEILKLARECGFDDPIKFADESVYAKKLIAFAHAIAAEQREIDARICELARAEDGDGQHTQWYAGVDECIAAIRNQKVEG